MEPTASKPPADPLLVDGSQGEGGGQVVRTALSLALLEGRPVTVENVRARRDRPGLLRQHLTAARAAAQLCGGTLEGDALHSSRLTLRPPPPAPGGAPMLRPGPHRFDIGSAGSATLVLQTLLPPLLVAGAGVGTEEAVPAVEVSVTGGTHNQKAPTFDYLDRVVLPLLRRMGARASLHLARHGFYPAGGGRIVLEVEPVAALRTLELHERGPILRRRARALVSRLPDHVGERELRQVLRHGEARSGPDGVPWETSLERIDSSGPGNVVVLEVESDAEHGAVREQFTGFGRRGLPAERVADLALTEFDAYLGHGAPVGEHLADQLVLPMALAGGGGFTTGPLSLHARTQIDLVRRVLALEIRVDERDGRVRVVFGGGTGRPISSSRRRRP